MDVESFSVYLSIHLSIYLFYFASCPLCLNCNAILSSSSVSLIKKNCINQSVFPLSCYLSIHLSVQYYISFICPSVFLIFI